MCCSTCPTYYYIPFLNSLWPGDEIKTCPVFPLWISCSLLWADREFCVRAAVRNSPFVVNYDLIWFFSVSAARELGSKKKQPISWFELVSLKKLWLTLTYPVTSMWHSFDCHKETVQELWVFPNHSSCTVKNILNMYKYICAKKTTLQKFLRCNQVKKTNNFSALAGSQNWFNNVELHCSTLLWLFKGQSSLALGKSKF